MWVFPDHMPTLASPLTGIRTYYALNSMQTTILTTRISVTLDISIIALLVAKLVPFCISVHERSRINRVLVPLLEFVLSWTPNELLLVLQPA